MAFPTDISFIQRAETELGVQLPQSFRARLLIENGGEVDALESSWELNPVFDTSDIKRTKRTANHIVIETAEARKWPGFHSKAVAIASDGSGNHLIFLPNDAGTGLQDAVFVWWHEKAEIERVAESFDRLQ
jgi:cell wall assembly regulator SMI1